MTNTRTEPNRYAMKLSRREIANVYLERQVFRRKKQLILTGILELFLIGGWLAYANLVSHDNYDGGLFIAVALVIPWVIYAISAAAESREDLFALLEQNGSPTSLRIELSEAEIRDLAWIRTERAYLKYRKAPNLYLILLAVAIFFVFPFAVKPLIGRVDSWILDPIVIVIFIYIIGAPMFDLIKTIKRNLYYRECRKAAVDHMIDGVKRGEE